MKAIIIIDESNLNDLGRIKKLVAEDFEIEKIIPDEKLDAEKVPRGRIVFLSGAHSHGKSSAKNEKSGHPERLKLIREYDGAIVGICAGFQEIAMANGGELVKRKRRLLFRLNIEMTTDLLAPLKFREKYKVMEFHVFDVEKVPQNIEILAKSRREIEIIKVKNRPIYGVQFHPEHRRPRNDGRKIYKAIVKAILRETGGEK